MGEKMDTLKTEIESWTRFGYALREDNGVLFRQMLDKCRKSEYLECVNAKGGNFTESLFLILILEQQKMINKLFERLGDKANAGKNA